MSVDLHSACAVSYTHLDVYKRQSKNNKHSLTVFLIKRLRLFSSLPTLKYNCVEVEPPIHSLQSLNLIFVLVFCVFKTRFIVNKYDMLKR